MKRISPLTVFNRIASLKVNLACIKDEMNLYNNVVIAGKTIVGQATNYLLYVHATQTQIIASAKRFGLMDKLELYPVGKQHHSAIECLNRVIQLRIENGKFSEELKLLEDMAETFSKNEVRVYKQKNVRRQLEMFYLNQENESF